MRLRDIDIATPDSPPSAAAQSPSIDAWLDVLDRLVRLPGPQRDSIRAELRSHLTERTRDLMLRGADGESAMRQAIEELGEAAELAERFRHANRYPRRRLIMNALLVGAGTVVVATTVAVMSRGGQNTTAQFNEPAVYTSAEREQRADDAGTLDSISIDVDQDMTPREIVQAIVATKKIGVSVDWGSLLEAGLDPDESLGFSGRDVSLLTLLTEINRRFDDAWDTIDWRLRDGFLVLDRRDVFDRQEARLVSYDISETLGSMFRDHGIDHEHATEQMSGLIYQMVEPEYWDVNGGATAHMQIVGGKMFVHAPMRMQEKVKWILDELSTQPDHVAMEASANVMPQMTKLELSIHTKRQAAFAGLRKISIAWNVWASEQDKPLEHMQQLVDAQYLQPGDLRSPVGPARDGRDYWIDFSFDPKTANPSDFDWSKRIVGLDRALYEVTNQYLLLFADSHLELVTDEQLPAMFAHPANTEVKPDLPHRRDASLHEIQRELEFVRLQQRYEHAQAMVSRVTEDRNQAVEVVRTLQHDLAVASRVSELAIQDNHALQEEIDRLRAATGQQDNDSDAVPAEASSELAGSSS